MAEAGPAIFGKIVIAPALLSGIIKPAHKPKIVLINKIFRRPVYSEKNAQNGWLMAKTARNKIIESFNENLSPPNVETREGKVGNTYFKLTQVSVHKRIGINVM